MPSVEFHRKRREALRKVTNGPVLLMGLGERARNIPMNHLPFRQDSSFLYFTGCTLRNAALLLTDDQCILFLPTPDEGDALWHGPTPSLQELGENLGFSHVKPRSELSQYVHPLARRLHTIAVSDLKINLELESMLNRSFRFGSINAEDRSLIDQICVLRRILQPEEIDEMRTALSVTHKGFIAAMNATHINGHEHEVAAAFHCELIKAGCAAAYSPIVTVDGHILHNHHHHNHLRPGQLLLLDGGAEAASGYATDITRTWPVSGSFNPQQLAAYSAVLDAQEQAISMLKKGTRYRDVHFKACEVLSSFLCEEKLLLCSAEEALETGAHALFFPHGIGHLLGLDVHDLENFGDVAAYAPGRTRPTDFGSAYLRLDLDVCPGMVVTIEPGFYIVPEIFRSPSLIEPHQTRIGWSTLEKWKGFGGIRIEDNILCTESEPEVLSATIPKTPKAIIEVMNHIEP